MPQEPAPHGQQLTDYARPLPASVIGRGTADGDPNAHLVYDQPEETSGEGDAQ